VGTFFCRGIFISVGGDSGVLSWFICFLVAEFIGFSVFIPGLVGVPVLVLGWRFFWDGSRLGEGLSIWDCLFSGGVVQGFSRSDFLGDARGESLGWVCS
jgi:hypothetical protein